MLSLRNIYIIICVMLLASCSTTEHVPEGDQLFTGLTKIDYRNYEKNDNFILAHMACGCGMLFMIHHRSLGSG